MSDVFLSYARQDKFLVGELAYALTREGWNVWWDSEILPGQAFTSAIEQELRQARCVVVVWSQHSVTSQWVRDEASQAAGRGVLIPVLVENVTPPLGLQAGQNADLRNWDGTVSHPGFVALARALQRIAGPARTARSKQGRISRKICLVGGTAVGKTSLVRRFVHTIFSERYLSTVGVMISRKDVRVGDTSCELVIWDLEGHDDLRIPRPSYLRGMSGYFLVIDGTRMSTLEQGIEIEQWVRNATQGPIPQITLINKADLSEEWSIKEASIHALRAQGWNVHLVSAKTGLGVEEAFYALSSQLLYSSWTFPDVIPSIGDFLDEPIGEDRLLGFALARNGGNFLAWARLARLLVERKESYLAHKAFERAQHTAPDSPAAQFALAEAFLWANRPLEAAQHLERSIHLDANVIPDAHLLLASTYVRLGSASRAAEQYERYLENYPAAADREEVKRRLEELRPLQDSRDGQCDK